MTVKIDPNVESGNAPYPRSRIINRLLWEPVENIIRLGRGLKEMPPYEGMDGSDNWPLTWGDDDSLYTAYGDGYGFDPILPEKLGMGFGKVNGCPPDIEALNIRSNGENKGPGRSGKKGSGMLMVNGVLYLWLFHADEKGGQSQLAWSSDHARTWTFSGWKFEEFGLCTFFNFGRNYGNARDEYVYIVTPDSPIADEPADRMILMRVPSNRITDRSAYEFLAAIGDDSPIWTDAISKRGTVFKHMDACLRSGISYNKPIGRYLWWQHIPNKPGHEDRGDTRYSGGFGIYDAPEPWGPWTTVYFTEKWDIGPGERAEFPPKWISADGKTLYLVFSGDDSFSVRKATLEI